MRLIGRIRRGEPAAAEQTADAVLTSAEAARTLALGLEHADPRDIELAIRVDLFNFAMEAADTPDGLEVTARS